MGIGPIRTAKGTKENEGQAPYSKEMATRGPSGRQRKPSGKAKDMQQETETDVIEVFAANTSDAKAKNTADNHTTLLLELIALQKQQFNELKAELAETKRQVADQAIAMQALMALVQAQPANVQSPSRASPTSQQSLAHPQTVDLAIFPPRPLHLRCHPE